MVLIQTGPGFGQLVTIDGKCQAVITCTDRGEPYLPGDRCSNDATVVDPRGPCFCWVHHKAFNNPARSYPLRLHKSATDGISP